jgi:hypothetical protein
MIGEQEHVIRKVGILARKESFGCIVGLIEFHFVSWKQRLKLWLIEIYRHSSSEKELKIWPDLKDIFLAGILQYFI